MVPKRTMFRRFMLPLAVFGTAALMAAGCGSDSKDDNAKSSDNTDTSASASMTSGANEWAFPNGDMANTRVANSNIKSSNVSDLKLLWKQPIYGAGQFGSMAAIPVIVDGVGYVQDLASNVYAFDMATGEQKWMRKYDSPDIGPNGVAVGEGMVFGATSNSAFALDQKTGKEIWNQKILTQKPGIGEGQTIGFTVQPTVHDGIVYLGEAAKAGGGDLLALDAKTGDVKWKFDSTDNPASDQTPSGGIWNTPAVDADGNSFFGIANGYYSYASPKSTQNERKYTDSVVALDPSGKLKWYMQGLTNDFYDWDMQLSPIIANTGGKDVIVSAGKMGYVYVTDKETGKLVWKQAVGTHNGHDTDGQKQLDGTLGTPKLPLTVFPGPYGGVETNMAVDGDTIYAAVVNLPGVAKTPKDLASPVLPVDFTKGTGELLALNLKDGTTKWKVDYPTLPLGAMTVSNDLVFTTTLDGKVHAYSTADGKEVWSNDMKVGSNSPLAIAGDYLFTAAAFPQGKGQKAMFYVYKLGATEVTPPATANKDTTGSAESAGADDSKAADTAGAQKVDITTKSGELKFSTDKLTAKAGKVTFTFTNPDSIAHDFRIEDKDGNEVGAGTKLISNGDSDSFTVDDLKPGTYTYYCTPHRSAGMTGTLTVS